MQGNLSECLETLLSLEKQHRLGEDITATKICCNAIIETLYLAKEWKLLNEHILLLAKRRSQLKQVLLSALVCHHWQLTSSPSDCLPAVYTIMCKHDSQSCTPVLRQSRSKACYAGYSVLCQAEHGLHSPDARQGHQDRAHQDPADRHRGQGNACTSRSLPAPAQLFAVLSLQSRHSTLCSQHP